MSQKFQGQGVVLLMSGPSGAGKSTICQQLMAEYPELAFSISCTTREPREGEVDAKDYFFVSVDDFKERIAHGEFLEYAEVHGNYYGTLKSEVADRLLKGQSVLIDIDVQGQRLVRQAIADDELLTKATTYLFVSPPSYGELESRLRGRGTETEERILKRLGNAAGEMAAWQEYDYLIVHDDLDKAVSELRSLFLTQKLQTPLLTAPEAWPK